VDLSAILQSKMTKLKIQTSPPKQEEVKKLCIEDLILPSPTSWTNFKLNSDEIIRAMSLSAQANAQPSMKVKAAPQSQPKRQEHSHNRSAKSNKRPPNKRK